MKLIGCIIVLAYIVLRIGLTAIWIMMVGQVAAHIGLSYDGGVWFAIIIYFSFVFDKNGKVTEAIVELAEELQK